MKPHDHEKLERFVHQALRDLPDRRAPRGLEARVLAAIANHQEESHGFLAWSGAARGAFFLASGLAVAGLMLLPSRAGLDLFPVDGTLATISGRANALLTAFSALRESARVIVGAINPYVVYGVLAAMVVAYGTLFGVGAAAFRILRQPSSDNIQ